LTRNRQQLIDWYARNRRRSKALFDLVSDGAYYTRPIGLRHPLVFYEGHLPGFSFNTLVKRGLGQPGIDAHLEALFARGIDPHEAAGPASRAGGMAVARRRPAVRRRGRSARHRGAPARGARSAW
jgi:hypothetical protein